MKLRYVVTALIATQGCHATPPVAVPPPAAVAPVPEIGPWGFDLAGMDRSVRPGASFARYANGGWLAIATIANDRSTISSLSAMSDRTDARTRQIVERAGGPPGSDGRRIADYYQTFLDEAAIEARGLAPIQPDLDRIAAIRDVRGVVRAFAELDRQGGTSPLFVFIGVDAHAPERYLVNVIPSGLGLPDRDMYDARAAQFATVRAAYRAYLAAMLTLVGGERAEARAAAVYALEAQLAAARATAAASRDPQQTYHKLAPAELRTLAPAIDWTSWLDAWELGSQRAVNITQPSAIAATGRLLASEPLATWRDYLTLRLLTRTAPYLPRAFVHARFEMFDKALAGRPQLADRRQRALDEVIGAMGEAIGKAYVATYFAPATRARVEALVANVRQAMARRIDRLTWMSAETKAKAQHKLAAIGVQLGAPRAWRDYAALRIVAGDAVGNARRAAELETRRWLAKLDQPVSEDLWDAWLTPMTTDAYASWREVIFGAGLFQPPMFDPHADDAINYGAIGAYIGHELSHHFDDRGAQYDATGALHPWWTPADAAQFQAATDRLVAQYSAYCPIPAADGQPARCVNGALTLGENVADLVGLTIAYDAYRTALAGAVPPVRDGFTGDQRFFLGWAQIWRSQRRPAALATDLGSDPHSPAELRIWTVRNLDAWYGAFAIAPADAMYLAPDQRVRIW